MHHFNQGLQIIQRGAGRRREKHRRTHFVPLPPGIAAILAAAVRRESF
jgi:hypothetical protein